jgi:hypothetical protein
VIEPQEVIGVERVEVVIGGDLRGSGIVEQRIDAPERCGRGSDRAASGVAPTSPWAKTASAPAAVTRRAVSSASPRLLAKLITTTRAPWSAAPTAIARPSPVDAPVITTTESA